LFPREVATRVAIAARQFDLLEAIFDFPGGLVHAWKQTSDARHTKNGKRPKGNTHEHF
jgi:hypothetical protein